MTGIAGRYLLSLGNVASSLILGALAFGFFWIYLPAWTLMLFNWARSIHGWVILGNWPAQYEVALRFFVDERQIVYLGFVLATRIVVGFLIMVVAKLLGSSRRKTVDPAQGVS